MRDLRVLLVDDHRVFTELLGFTLDAQPGIRCVGKARTVRAARELAETMSFDAAVLDVTLPDGNGIALARSLRELHPGARYVALTAFPTPEVAAAAAAAAVPLLAKDGTFSAILAELQLAEVVDEVPRITAREREVLELLAEGIPPQAIARTLRISLHTTRGHVKMLLLKTGTRSQLEAVAVARRSGLLEPILTP